MLPPLTDFFALLGIDLVLGAGLLRLLARWPRGARWAAIGLMLVLWIPVGNAHLPLLGYVRGISSDLSITLVALAVLGALRRWRGQVAAPAAREIHVVRIVVACAAIFLYPTALGWGDWDAYRVGWIAWPLILVVLLLAVGGWLAGLRLLPGLVALALLAWAGGLLESSNLWDYFLDPWLAIAALFQVTKLLISTLWRKVHGMVGRVS